MEAQNVAGMGHNNPPSDAELFAQSMIENNKEILAKADEISKALVRLKKELETEEDAEAVTKYIKQANTCRTLIEDVRKAEKAPILAKGKMVDDFFGAYNNSLTDVATKAKAVLDKYLKAKVEKQKAALAAQAKLQQEQAEALASVAAKVESVNQGSADNLLESALEAEAKAVKLTASSVKNTGHAAIRSETGASAALREVSVAEIVNLNELDLNALRFFFKLEDIQKALNSCMKSGAPAPHGAVFSKRQETVVR